VLAPAAVEGASFPPDLHFRTLEAGHVVIHYPRELEAMARQAAALANEILAHHEARYHSGVGRVQIVLADVADDPNGFATPLPYPLVHIRALAPDGTDEFGNHASWLRLVLTHELTHIVHLEEARGVIRFGRQVLGRAPYLFPNALTPGWLLEGLATFEETEGTPFGRGRNPDVRMVLRSAVLAGELHGEDQANLGLDRWPDGQSAYFYGEAFLRDLDRRFGSRTLPEIARVHSGHVIPYADDYTAYEVTGGTFHTRWLEWEKIELTAFEKEARAITARGVTPSTPLTSRGIRQTGPRFSPDGAWVAYTSRTLTRYGAIRVVRSDGTGDRFVANRNSGSTLSWTPDGSALVFDEEEVHDLFRTYSDLRRVDVATGRVRRLTRGLRARDPDVSPDGQAIVFVRETSSGSEVDVVAADGTGLRVLVPGATGVEWSGPRWSPRGDALVASRLGLGGWLDLVTIDLTTGALVGLTDDRAKDVEPTWSGDGRHVLFRSDRDGVSNLYAVRLADGALLRVSNVLGGAFTPDVAPGGERLAYADYSAAGYDVRTMPLRLEGLPEAEPFSDPYPADRPDPPPAGGADRAYRPGSTLLPRFWTPYVVGLFSGETKIGVATGATDPIFRHAYGVDVHVGTDTGRLGFQGYYQYDRFLPTLSVIAEDTSDPEGLDGFSRTQALTLRASVPVARSLRSAQTVTLAWKRERDSVEDRTQVSRLDLGGIEAAWSLGSARQFPYSPSPVEGWRLFTALLKEDPTLGSDVSLWKATADARAYTRVFGETDSLSLRMGGGTTFGRPGFDDSFRLGGFPDGSLFDVAGTNVSLLRGYADDAFHGRSVVHANAEYRLPLAHPQQGYRSFPVFVRHLHASAFVDVGEAWSDAFEVGDLKPGVGVSLGADFIIGHHLPLTGIVSLARGLASRGDTQVYARVGLPF
jgi:Tol biopolymer transport system component